MGAAPTVVIERLTIWIPLNLKPFSKKFSECPPLGLTQPAEVANSIIGRSTPKTYGELNVEITHLSESLSRELEKEVVFRIAPEQKDYFERNDLFGPEVAAAFPSCERDIRKAGSCYALRQEDACVHHLMLVLARGWYALAVRLNVSGHYANWQTITMCCMHLVRERVAPA